MKDGPVVPELDRGSYLSTYGLLNPWTLWLLAQAPELVAVRPSELQHRNRRTPLPGPVLRCR